MTTLIAYIIIFYVLANIGFKIIRKNWDVLAAMAGGIAAFIAVAQHRKDNRPMRGRTIRMDPPTAYERQQTPGSVHFEDAPF